MSALKYYKKRKYLFFALTFIAYFAPLIVSVSCFFPFMRYKSEGVKITCGLVLVIANTLPFLTGILKHFFAHYPFLNVVAIAFCFLAFIFNSNALKNYTYSLIIIEICSTAGSIIACIFWSRYLSYAGQVKIEKTNKKSEKIEKREEARNDNTR